MKKQATQRNSIRVFSVYFSILDRADAHYPDYYDDSNFFFKNVANLNFSYLSDFFLFLLEKGFSSVLIGDIIYADKF